jgi:hypothetical protein
MLKNGSKFNLFFLIYRDPIVQHFKTLSANINFNKPIVIIINF